MRSSLRTLIKKVQAQSEHVAASSEQLTASAQQSALAANQVAGSITEIAGGTEKQSAAAAQCEQIVEHMSNSTNLVADIALQISQIAEKGSQEAGQGGQEVERVVNQMNQIGQGSEVLQTAIAELAQGSQEISNIVTLISTIAGQTNLLALNAAIEAARAGENGRGFAVVADEVRKLAEESNQAAQQIGSLILRNQTNMDQAIAASQAGATGIKAGISVVNSAGDTFNRLVKTIMQLSEQSKEIAESITNMTKGNQALVTSINEIARVSRENTGETQTVSAATEEQSASMEEIASSSQSLANLAGELQDAIAKFHV